MHYRIADCYVVVDTFIFFNSARAYISDMVYKINIADVDKRNSQLLPATNI